MLDFRNSKFYRPIRLRIRGSQCGVIIPNLVAIRRLSYGDVMAIRRLGIIKTRIFNCHCALLRKSSWQLIKSFVRYGEFSIFSKW